MNVEKVGKKVSKIQLEEISKAFSTMGYKYSKVVIIARLTYLRMV